MSWFKEITVDHIVSGLGDMVKRLERHAAEKEAEAWEHLKHAASRRAAADEAKVHSTRATAIAEKIGALVQ